MRVRRSCLVGPGVEPENAEEKAAEDHLAAEHEAERAGDHPAERITRVHERAETLSAPDRHRRHRQAEPGEHEQGAGDEAGFEGDVAEPVVEARLRAAQPGANREELAQYR